MNSDLGRMLVIAGVALVAVGLLLMYGRHIPLLGRLPGDIRIQRDGFQFYFPLATCLVLSVVLSLVMRFFRK